MSKSKVGKRYWIADLHLGHDKVAGLRELSTARHDQQVMQALMSTREEDTIWILGDLSSSRPAEQERALQMLSDVPATMHLIAGNHDPVSSTNRNGWKYQRAYLAVFESVQQFGRIRMLGKQILMSHYPYAWAGDGEGRDATGRYLEYRLPDVGFPLLHGHTHQSTAHIKEDRSMFCVSWDAHGKLVDEGTINHWLAEG